MGVNTDGEEMGPGSTVTDGVKLTAEACEVIQENGNEKSLPQDAVGDVGIQDQKQAKGTGIPLIPFLKVPSQSSVLNTEHNTPQREHAEEGDSFLSNTTTTQKYDADIETRKTELSRSAPVVLDTDTSADDTCIPLEECTSLLQLTKVMSLCDHLNTNTNEDRDAMTIEGEIHHSTTRTVRPDSSVNPRIDQMDEEGYTQLYKAALEGHLEGVQDLISRGANPNKPSKAGLRPLHAAARKGNTHIVKFLIMHGAVVTIGCDLGQTPLHIAAVNGYADIVKTFISEGSDVNKGDDNGWTPFNAAIQEGNLETVKYLLTEGAKQNRYDGMTPLYAAAQSGHLDIVKFFISNGAGVNEKDDAGVIPLHIAAFHGHMAVLEYLIQQGSDVNKGDDDGWTPFNAAIQEDHLETVKYLLSKGAKQNRYNGMTPLYAAAQSGHLDIVQFFISNGADVNEEDDVGMIPLHGASTDGNVEVMKCLIKQGSDVNWKDKTGWTPFNAAVQNGNLEAVKCLLGMNAAKNIYNGITPLYSAARFGHVDLVEFFISKGVYVNEENDAGRIPFPREAIDGNIEVMKYLIHHGSHVNDSDAKGFKTPFNSAVQYGHLEVVKCFVNNGTKQNRYAGMTPLYDAAQFGHLDIVKFLVSKGADVNEEDDKGMIPLHGAAIRGHIEVIEYLIQQGSGVNKENNTGWTPFNAAVQNGHLEAVKYLMTEGAKQNRYDGMTPLYEAARIGHLDLVKLFLSEGADVNEEDYKGRIPLHGAAARGHMKVMEYLIQQGSDVDKKDADGWTPFNAAVRKGHLEAVKYLMTKGAKQTKSAGMIPVYNAAYSGHLDIVKCFISKGTDVNEEDDDGMTPLHGAAACGRMAVMEYLIEQGSDVNKKDNTGWTPFNAAARNGHLEAVKYLMTKGAKQNRCAGMTPVYSAAYFGRLDIVDFFISKGADVNEEDDHDGMTPLHGAADSGRMEVMEYLIQQGSDVNKRDCKGRTPLHAAVENGNLEVVKFLVAKGAKGTTCYGLTPLYIATQYDHVDVVNFLVSNRYDVNERNECGKSPLHAACYNGNMDIVNVFIHHNANVNEQDQDGWTPLHAAAQEGHQDIVHYLTLNGADMNVRDIDGLTPLQAAANTAHQHTIEDISTCRPDPDEEETGDPRSGGHQNLISSGNVTVSLNDADTQSRTGKLASQVDNTEDGNDCTQADNAKRGADEPSFKSLPTGIHDDKKVGRGEHNPFIRAKLKYPEKVEQDPMLDQIEPIQNLVPRQRDTDVTSPRGHQTWQYSGYDPPRLQTIEIYGHPSKGAESRCHSLIENRGMIESSSPMNAGNYLPIKETSVKFESFSKHPPAVVHQKLYDGSPVSTHETSSNPVWKIGTKRRTSVDRCPSILALVQTFLQVIIALAIILAGSPVLVAGRDITERVTLQAGKRGVVPFHLPSSPSDTFQGAPQFTLRFESKPRPFCINGLVDIQGFKSSSQFQRFTTSVTDLDTSPCVNLMIDNVDALDEDGYILTVIWHSLENVRYDTVKKEVDVQIPPGPAKCFITLSENSYHPYEVHCRATTGSVITTLSCYQNDRRIDIRCDITDNGLITRGIFWLPDNTYFSCCSHDVTSHVNETMCNDFEWLPDMHDKKTTSQIVNTVPTFVTNRLANERPKTTPTTQMESHLESGACRQSMLPSIWYFTYLFVYLLAFVTM